MRPCNQQSQDGNGNGKHRNKSVSFQTGERPPYCFCSMMEIVITQMDIKEQQESELALLQIHAYSDCKC